MNPFFVSKSDRIRTRELRVEDNSDQTPTCEQGYHRVNDDVRVFLDVVISYDKPI